MPQCHRGGDFVHVLAARATGTRERFLKIDIAHAQTLPSLRERVSNHLLVGIDELCNQSATLLRRSKSAGRFAGENRIKIGQHVLWPEKL